MNSSTPSLLSPPPDPNLSTTNLSIRGASSSSSSTKKNNALAFLKFPKRSPRSPPAAGTSSSAPAASVLVIGNPISTPEDELPPPPQEDDGISLPWNFQHNIHVDEGYVGIPPSWSTSLASAGFTDEEIAAIQARRAIRSPPDLRYLYNERPQTPAGATFPSSVPILANPLPRSTSLRRLAAEPASSPFPPRPELPNIATSAPATSSAPSAAITNPSASSSSNTPLSTRKPPPRRKPPSPTEADLADEAKQKGGQAHRANQASQSTMGNSEEFSGSSSNHSATDNTANTSFAGLNNSFAYKYNPGDTTITSANPAYTQRGAYATDAEDTDDDTPLAHAPLRLGSESAFSATSTLPGGIGRGQKAGGPGGSSGFKVVNGDSTDGEDGQSGTRRVGGGDGAQNGVYAGGGLDLEAPDHPREKKSSIWGTKIGKLKSKEGSTSTHGSEGQSTSASLGVPVSVAASASTSALATAQTWKANTSTSIASVVSKGGSLVDAMRGGVAKMTHRTPSGSSSSSAPVNGAKKKKSGIGSGLAASFRNRRAGASAEGSAENEEDEEGEGSDEEFVSLPDEAGPPVWEIYRRPRAGTDAGSCTSARGANQSTESLGRSALKRSASGRAGQPPPGVVGPEGQLLRKSSMRSQASQSTPSLRLKSSQSGGSLRSLALGGGGGRAGGHKKSGSTTSLESIPEVSPPPLPPGAAARAGVANANGSSSSSSSPSKSTVPGLPPVTKKAPALPPRLSLHQYSGSSDLSAWSESLLSGISLSAAGQELGFGLGLDLDFGGDGGKGKEREKEPMSAPPTATQNGGLTARPLAPPMHSHSQSQSQTGAGTAQSRAQQQQEPIVRSGTPSQRMRKAGQPLPSSKPPPQGPIPPIVVGSSSSSSSSSLPLNIPTISHPYAQVAAYGTRSVASSVSSLHGRSRSNSRSRPPVPTHTVSNSLSQSVSGLDSPAPLSGVAEAPTTARFALPTPTPTPLPPTAPLSASLNKPLPVRQDSSDAPSARGPPPSAAAAGLLSPPPTAWSTAAEGVVSPAGSSAGPDSAQLWNEIEHMMDPGMMSSIPGLHLSVALPPGAQGVLRSAGLGRGQGHGQPPAPLSLPPVGVAVAAGVKPVRTVGDLVGQSPTYSAAVNEAFSATLPFTPEEERMEAQRRIRATEGVLGTKSPVDEQKPTVQLAISAADDVDDDEDAGSGSEYSDEEEDPYSPYDAIEDVQPERMQLRSRSPSRERQHSGRLLTVSNSHEHDADHLRERDTNRDSSRSSSSTLTVTALAATTIVRNVSIARRTGAYVIDKRNVRRADSESSVPSPTTPSTAGVLGFSNDSRPLPSSPLSSHFGGTGSEESGSNGSVSSSSQEQELHPTPTTDGGIGSPLFYYLDGTQTPSPNPDKLLFDQRDRMPNIHAHSHANSKDEPYEPPFEGYPDEETMAAEAAAAAAAVATTPSPTNAQRPTIIISDAPLSGGGTMPLTTSTSTPGTSTPLSPFQRYRGWLSAVVAPLEEFIDEAVDPRDHYLNMTEIAEGESGSVFAATLNPSTAAKLRLPPLVKARDADEIMAGRSVMVAIKSVVIVPSGSPKLVDLQRELSLMRGLGHDNILGMDGVYVDLQEDSLWVRMELMERSLADIIGLVGDGLQLQERTIARFASDVLCALEFLQRHNIAHRDVRSDNLLLNKQGVLKLADFSNAVQVTAESPMRSDIVGVAYWQAPEVRRPPYDALTVDVWSLGATVWEMAQQDPPFVDTQQLADRWPPLRQPELFSPAFHDFLRKCSEPASVRPSPSELLKSSLIVSKACGRQVIVLLLNQCLAMEKALQEGNAEA
ncbi:hypothetical protein BDN70DRAFT_857053 [Pholiota conissans]|uniref:Non-specific serine/threonine protein kinase n=1 Tax=Pholiota conissans TaxID=109636 RepID=A0A9P5Z2M3_9AGAR|nr:hypothetical protein BDN70DRAFT_857053 [Pholiota conissans]